LLADNAAPAALARRVIEDITGHTAAGPAVVSQKCDSLVTSPAP
jgi:hypothetical protein